MREEIAAPATPDGDAGARQRALGLRLQALRRARSLSLRDTASAVGVSASFLGMVERGETDLSLARFSRLADFFDIPAGELLAEDGKISPPHVTAVAEGEEVDRGPGVDYRIVRREHPQLVAVTIAPGARFADARAHVGEDIWIVVDGRATFHYGGARFDVAAANLVSFSGLVPHAVANETDAPVTLFAICSAPYW